MTQALGFDLSRILHLELLTILPHDKYLLEKMSSLECFTVCDYPDDGEGILDAADLEFMSCIPWRAWHTFGRLQILNGPHSCSVPTSFSEALSRGAELRMLDRECPHGRDLLL